MLSLPQFGWRSIFTTNYDQLMERSYNRSRVPLVPIRSNFDFSRTEGQFGTRLYKIHGCISEDRSSGSQASMILTERDYEDYSKYRQVLFVKLEADLLSGDAL